MALIAHPGQQEIKARILAVLQLEIRPQSLLVFLRGLLRVRIFPFDSRDLLRFQRGFRKHRFGRHAEIAVRVSGADMALVAEKQKYFIPRNLRAQRRIVGEEAVERFRSRATCERRSKGTSFPHRGCCGFQELLSRAVRDGCAICENSNFTFHTRSWEMSSVNRAGALPKLLMARFFLDVSAELEAHGGQYPCREIVFSARRKALVE